MGQAFPKPYNGLGASIGDPAHGGQHIIEAYGVE
jgi:hypothetical protein